MADLASAALVDLGRVRREMDRIAKGILEAQRAAVGDATKDAERALEVATAGAGLGKLSKAWKSKLYPLRGLSDDPAGLIYPKGGERTKGAIAAQSYGARIAAHGGGLLPVPLPAAAFGRKRRPSPEEWQAAHPGVELVKVERPGKPILLVAVEARLTGKTGRVRAASETAIRRGRTTSVPLFVLVPVVSIRGRFSIQSTVRPFGERLAQQFVGRAGRIA